MCALILSYMVMEMYGKVEEVLKYYHSGSDHPFNFALIAMNRTCDGHCLRRLVGSFLDNMPADKWPSWVVSSSIFTDPILQV